MEYLNKFLQSQEIPSSKSIMSHLASLTSRLLQLETKCSVKRDQIVSTFFDPQPAMQDTKDLSSQALTEVSKMPFSEEGKGHKTDQRRPPEPSNACDSIRYNLCRKLYKKVAMVAHPDKRRDGKYSSIFPIAARAQEELDLTALAYVCHHTNARVSLSDEELAILTCEVERLEDRIGELKKSIYNQWDGLTDDQRELSLDILRKARQSR